MITAYREPDRAMGRELMRAVIESLTAGIPAALTELITRGLSTQGRQRCRRIGEI